MTYVVLVVALEVTFVVAKLIQDHQWRMAAATYRGRVITLITT